MLVEAPAVVGGEAVVVSGGGEGRFHGREGKLAFHGVDDLVSGVCGGRGSARRRHGTAAAEGGGGRMRDRKV